MKFWAETKKKADAIRKAIREYCKEKDVITEANIIELFGHVPDPETKKYFWNSEDVLKKIRVRQTKDGWWLYLPEPERKSALNSTLEDHGINIVVFDEDEFYEKVGDIINATLFSASWLDFSPNNRCKVISKPTKNTVREEFGYASSMPFQLTFTKSNDEVVAFPVYVVRMDDGSVRQVKPENIIFEEIE